MFVLWPASPATLGLTLLGKLKLSYIKITEQTTWLKKMTSLTGSLFDLFDFDWFGSWGPWLQSAIQILGIILLIIIIIISLVLCILSKTLKCVFGAAHYQASELTKTRTTEKEQRE